MQVKIFKKETLEELEKVVNKFLKGLPCSDIVKTETVPLSLECGGIKVPELAVFVWLRADAVEA